MNPNPVDDKIIDTLDSFQDYLWEVKHPDKQRMTALMAELRDAKKLLINRQYSCVSGKHAGDCTCEVRIGQSVADLYNKSRKKKGFTLIELVIVMAIVSILALGSIFKLRQAVYRAQENMTLANLRALRSAISLYSVDHGHYPTDNLTCLITEGYLTKFPLERTPPYHSGGNSVGAGPRSSWGESLLHWYYFNDPNEPEYYGRIVVDCGHVDSRGVIWSDR